MKRDEQGTSPVVKPVVVGEVIKRPQEKGVRGVGRGSSGVDSAALERWRPKTALGRAVQKGEMTDLGEILDQGKVVLEAEIVDTLLPNLRSDLLGIGQSKGKFGGGKRSIWRQVQKKTAEGNKASFAALAVVGNEDGFVGIGYGKARETVPAREKAVRKAKVSVIKVRRGCGSWECRCETPHSLPLKVTGRCGSVTITLIPAPKGTGLVVEKQCAKILQSAGIKDVYAKSSGNTNTKLNMLRACFDALKLLSEVRVQDAHKKRLGLTEGMKQ